MTRTQLNFRLSDQLKAQWADHVEESPKYSTLSDFVRQAAINQIERDNGDRQPMSEPAFTDEQLNQMTSSIDGVIHRLEELEESMTRVYELVQAQTQADMVDIMAVVFQTLPASKEDAVRADDMRVEVKGQLYDTTTIGMALERLVNETKSVKRVTEDDETRWYKEAGTVNERLSRGEIQVFSSE